MKNFAQKDAQIARGGVQDSPGSYIENQSHGSGSGSPDEIPVPNINFQDQPLPVVHESSKVYSQENDEQEQQNLV